MDRESWLERCAAVLKSNQVQSGDFHYTRPAPMTYEHQWLWDSCFHALAYRHFDPAMARSELLSVIAHQHTTGDDSGMIPHMAYWKGGGSELWGRDDCSIITQPPLIAVAARKVAQQDGDGSFLKPIYEAIAAFHQWFDRRRDPDGDHLVCLIHPWETGWDFSPRWDRLVYIRDNPTDEEARITRIRLVSALIDHACDPVRLAEDGFYHVEPADFNAIRAADLESLAWIAHQIGRESEAAYWSNKAQAVQAAIQTKMVQDDRVLDLAGLDEMPLEESTAGEFVTLFGGCVSSDTASLVVQRLQRPEYWTPYPVPVSPTTSAYFDGNRYWRGNVWLNVNWLICSGLRRYGYTDLAAEIGKRSRKLVEEKGFREYYHPLTGQGLGASPQSWSTIVIDL